MATHSPLSSPPIAKRPKLDDEAPAELSPARPPLNGTPTRNGAVGGSPATKASAPIETKDEDSDSDDEDELPLPVKEEEDVARRDMYLDTVSMPCWNLV